MPSSTPSNSSGKIIFHGGTSNRSLHIFRVDANGKNLKQLTHSPEKVWNILPIVSPDGRTIAFTSETHGGFVMCLVNSDGTGERCLAPDKFHPFVSSFSPDGAQIATAIRGGVHLINLDGTNGRQITCETDESGSHHTPVFTPDGSRIIYISGKVSPQLWSVDIGTGKSELIPVQESPEYRTYRSVKAGPTSCMSVSPNGKTIALQKGWCRSHPQDGYEWVYAIFTCHIDGSQGKKISGDFFTAENARFSPDGNLLTFVAKAIESSRNHVYVMRLEESQPQKVSHAFGEAYSPTFSPDSLRLAFKGRKKGDKQSHLFTTRLDGTDIHQITDSQSGGGLSWVPKQ